MSSASVTVLLIESTEAQARRVAELLRASAQKRFEVRHVASVGEALEQAAGVDVVILDPHVPDGEAFAAFERVQEQMREVPILLLAGKQDAELAADVLSRGAQDVLSADQLDTRLITLAIDHAIQRHLMLSVLEKKVKEYQEGQARFFNMVANNADGIVVVDRKGVVRFVNPAAANLFNRSAESLMGKPFELTVRNGETRELPLEIGQGDDAIVEMRVVETLWEGEKANLISVRDISMRKQAERVLRESEERYALAIRGSQDGVWDWDLVDNSVFYSLQWKQMLGYSSGEIGDTPGEWLDRIHSEDSARVKEAIDKHVAGKTPSFEAEFRILHKDGAYRWVLARASAVRDGTGRAYRIAGSQGDITARKKAEGELKKALTDLQFALASEKVLMEELDRKNRELIELSITDGLTGLYNHRFLQERFDFEFKRVERYGGHLSCMMIDIDHFKSINDTYGHQFGDQVLRELSDILKNNSREVDICGRYGGEEFMIVSNLQAENALKHATKIHKAVEKHTFARGDQAKHVTVSIGIAEYRGDIRHKQQLIERADTALYEAKEAGRNVIRVWKEQDVDDVSPLDRYGIRDLKKKFHGLSTQIRETYVDSTYALVKAVEAKDPHTIGHADNVAYYSVKIAELMDMSPEDIEVIKYAALLHDVGKIGVSQDILVKKTPLTDAEFELLKRHPVIGVNILGDVSFLERELPIILHHHERVDGSGYPHGFRGREIPVGARILAVVDAFEAITAGRSYRGRRSEKEAIEELARGRGAQFSADIVDVFLEVLKKSPRREETLTFFDH